MFSHQELLKEIPNLKRFAHKLSGNAYDAEDLLHSTVERALEKKGYFEDGTSFFKWSSKIMYNLFVSDYRRRTRFETQYDPEPYLQGQKIDPAQEESFQLSQVDAAMKKLSPEHREILILICIKGMKYQQVAAMLDMPVGTVRSRLSRAREQLRNLLRM